MRILNQSLMVAMWSLGLSGSTSGVERLKGKAALVWERRRESRRRGEEGEKLGVGVMDCMIICCFRLRMCLTWTG